MKVARIKDIRILNCEVEEMPLESLKGFWNLLEIHEQNAIKKNRQVLSKFEMPVKTCYECGIESVMLPHRQEHTRDIRVAGLLLKRALNDLRVIWNLLELGYTSQAATVATTIFENALLITCMVGHIDRAERWEREEGGYSPWSIAQLCKMHARDHLGLRADETSVDFNTFWRSQYIPYGYLCKIKHPTINSLVHDAKAATLDDESGYLITTSPDSRTEDLRNKGSILSMMVFQLYRAIRDLIDGLAVDKESIRYKSWLERFNTIYNDVNQAMEPLLKDSTPIDINNEKVASELREIEKKKSDS